MFYVPVIFSSLGSNNAASLLNTVVRCLVVRGSLVRVVSSEADLVPCGFRVQGFPHASQHPGASTTWHRLHGTGCSCVACGPCPLPGLPLHVAHGRREAANPSLLWSMPPPADHWRCQHGLNIRFHPERWAGVGVRGGRQLACPPLPLIPAGWRWGKDNGHGSSCQSRATCHQCTLMSGRVAATHAPAG